METFVQITNNPIINLPNAINQNCVDLKLIDNNNNLQKIVTGDTKGKIMQFQRNKGTTKIMAQNQECEKEISNISCQDNRIYYTAGTIIGAINNSGDSMFQQQSNSTEQIQYFSQSNSQQCLNIASDFSIDKFEQNQKENGIFEKYNYLSESKINVIHSIGGDSLLVGCKDNTLQYFNEKLEQISSQRTTSTLLSIQQFQEKNNLSRQLNLNNNNFLFGYQNGLVQQVSVEDPNQIHEKFQIVSQNSSILNMGLSDITSNGINDILISNSDQKLEMYQIDLNQEPQKFWEKQLTDSIAGIKGGFVTNSKVGEFIVSNFSGTIQSYLDADIKFEEDQQLIELQLNQGQDQQEKNQKKSRFKGKSAKDGINNSNKDDQFIEQQNEHLQNLQDDINQLEIQIQECEEQIQMNQQQSNQNLLPQISQQDFKLKADLNFNIDGGYYDLQIKCEYSIEMVAISGDLNMEIIKNQEKDQIGVISISKYKNFNSNNQNQLQATLRIQEGDYKTVKFKLRSLEGQQGEISCFVIPQQYPMNCQCIKVQLKTLQMHQKKEILLNDEQKNCLSYIKFTGNFSVDDAHIWLQSMIPDVQSLITHQDDENIDRQNNDDNNQKQCIQFQQMYIGSILLVEYCDNEALFYSDSVNTLYIIKEFIIQKTNERQRQVDLKFDIKQEMVERVIRLIDKKFVIYNQQQMEFKLIPALKEIKLMFQSDEQQQQQQITQNNDNFIDQNQEYQDILEREQIIIKEYEYLPQKIEFLISIIVRIYVDYQKFKQQDINEEKIKYFKKQIENNYSLDKLFKFCIQ